MGESIIIIIILIFLLPTYFSFFYSLFFNIWKENLTNILFHDFVKDRK